MPDTPTFASFQAGLVSGSNTRPHDPITELQIKNGKSYYYFHKIQISKKKKEKKKGNGNRPGRRKGQRIAVTARRLLIHPCMYI